LQRPLYRRRAADYAEFIIGGAKPDRWLIRARRYCWGRTQLDEIDMPEIINFGSLQLKFLQSKDDTAGSLDMFEMTLQPNARMPIPHYHDRWDETIYGLTGTTSWRIDGNDIDVAPGETVFIKRGVVHGFANRSTAPATCLCTLSPGVLGPQYFKDMAKLLSAGTPDPAKMKETMLRYGLIPTAPS
jgi:quercetin dioxygenase-like cupin family protein